MALTWKRRYSTGLLESPATPLGSGWATRYFTTLTQSEEGYIFKTPEGSEEVFADPDGRVARGEIVRNLGTFKELTKRSNYYYVTQWDVASREITRFVFKLGARGRAWPLVSIEDATGQGLDMLYDVAGRLIGVRQRLEQRTLQLEYTATHRIAAIYLAAPNAQRQLLMQYEYHQNGQLSAAVDALGYADRYEYDAAGRLKREMIKDGGVFSLQYDDQGRCMRRAGLDNYDAKTLRFLDHVGWTEVTDSHGYVTHYQWQPSGQVIQIVDRVGAVWLTEYDEEGRILTETDPNGAVTTYEYDDQGNRSAITDALGQTTSYVYNEVHQLVAYTNPAGHTWRMAYDGNNRLVIYEEPVGSQYMLRYDDRGNMIEMINPLGYVARQSYTSQGVLQTMTDWEGHTTRYETDAFGRLSAKLDPLNQEINYHYDAVNNLLGIDYPDDTQDRYTYDAGRNVVRFTDRIGATYRFRYGTCHRMLEKTDPLGHTTRFQWGSEPGELQSITNPKGDVYAFERDPVGQVVSETTFEGRSIQFEYNPAGHRIARINGLGERIATERDLLGQLKRIVLPDGEETQYTYDAAGFIIGASNSNSDIAFERDGLGRIVREKQNGHLLEREYDEKGSLEKLRSDLGLEVAYGFNLNGMLVQCEVNDQPVMEVQRDARGAEVRRSLPGQSTTLHQQFDAMGRLERQVVGSATGAFGTSSAEVASPLVQRTYQFEQARFVGVDDQTWGEATFTYDALYRLTSVKREAGEDEYYQYDATGNLTQIAQGTRTDTAAYVPGDRLAQKGNIQYEYDAQGRLITKAEVQPDGDVRAWAYAWDAQDRLRTVTNPEGKTWRYAYDPFGRRIERQTPDGQRLRFVWDEDVVLHELEGEQVAASWIFDPHSFSPLYKLDDNQLYGVINDQIGTPREMVGSNGQVVWQVDYTAWGTIREQKASLLDCPVRFQGQWHDVEEGLHYNRFRYYDPHSGRYISPDPIRLRGGFNLFRYAPNPLVWIDPWGWQTYITYLGRKNGKPYMGFASHPESGKSGVDVLKYRYGGTQFTPFDGGAQPEPLYVGDSRATARGLEQRGFEIIEGGQNTADNQLRPNKTSNEQNPVGLGNQNRDTYLNAADEHLAENEDLRNRLQREAEACEG